MAHSLYLKKLRAGMERPNARLGNGSTAAAIRYERLTGLLTEGKSHLEKGKDGMLKLEKWLKANPDATPSDRRTIENIIRDDTFSSHWILPHIGTRSRQAIQESDAFQKTKTPGF